MRDNSSLIGATSILKTAAIPLSPESLWRSIRFFNLYRLIIGGVLLLMYSVIGKLLSFDLPHQSLLFWISAAYTVLVFAAMVPISLRRPRVALQLAMLVCVDIAAVAALMYFSEGAQGNLGMLLLVSLALAGMISRGRITMLYAALASIAILLEHGYAVLTTDASAAQFFQLGILCTSYFAVAWLAHTLSRYAVASEKLALLREVDLANMAEANRLTIQDMPDGVLVVDERSQVRQSNPGAERLLGYRFSDGQSHTLAECSPVLDALFAGWRQNKALGQEVLHLPGTDHPVRVRFLAVEREGFWGAVVVLEDMQRVQEQAQQVKLAALGRLTANIAHEVRNPLSSISYAAELLKEQIADEAQSRFVQIILDNTTRLNRIIHDVMQVNRRDRAQPEQLNVPACVEEVLGNLSQTEQVARNVFELRVEPSARIYFDRGHFEQVIWNLCRNALRYSQRRPGSVRVIVSMEEGRRVLEVSDDGRGVPEESVQKLFEPFFTTDKGGTGLGLYIARELCEANGATIEYKRALDGGACFRLLFGSNHES